MSKHTPGPWKWWTSCSWRRLLNEDGSKRILQPTNHPMDKHPDIIVTDADMKLIEAAPELLASLRECAALVETEIANLVDAHTSPDSKMIEDPDDQAYIDREQAVLDRATVAITKAEGK
jgi:hypothetical protein